MVFGTDILISAAIQLPLAILINQPPVVFFQGDSAIALMEHIALTLGKWRCKLFIAYRIAVMVNEKSHVAFLHTGHTVREYPSMVVFGRYLYLASKAIDVATLLAIAEYRQRIVILRTYYPRYLTLVHLLACCIVVKVGIVPCVVVLHIGNILAELMFCQFCLAVCLFLNILL